MPSPLPRHRLAGALLSVTCVAGLGASATAAVPRLPDLTPRSVTVAKGAKARGSAFVVRNSVRNGGRASSKRSGVRFYLSRDRRRSRTDIRLEGKRTLRALRPAARSFGRTRVRVGRRTRPGRYWVLACTDGGRRIREANERNNCRRTLRRIRVIVPAPVLGPPAPPAPPGPPPGPPVVAAAGDIACDPADSGYNGGQGTTSRCRQMQTSDLLAGADKVLALGDIQYENATLAKFNQVYDKSWGRFKSLTSPAIGNHEYDFDAANTAQGYFDYFNGVGQFSGPAGDRDKGYYSYNLGSWHLVALNSNCGRGTVRCEAGSAQEQWLRRDLAANPARCTLAYWHHPLFSSSDAATKYSTPAVKPLWQALREYNVDVLLTGHAHAYERFARLTEDGVPDDQGVRQFISGTGGKSHHAIGTVLDTSKFQDATNYGVLKLTLKSGSYDWGFQTEHQGVLDPGSETCT